MRLHVLRGVLTYLILTSFVYLHLTWQEAPESKSLSNDPRKNVKLDHHLEIETVISGVSGCSSGNSL